MRKEILVLFLIWPIASQAEIYKCKDAKGKYLYQEIPCQSQQVTKIRKDAGVAEEDRLRAQNRIDAVFEREHQREIQAENARLERIKQAEVAEEKELERRKVEYLKRQAIASEKNAVANERSAEATENIQKSLNKPVRCVSDNAGGYRCY